MVVRQCLTAACSENLLRVGVQSTDEVQELPRVIVLVVDQAEGRVERVQKFPALGVGGLQAAAAIEVATVVLVRFLEDAFDDVVDLAVPDERIGGSLLAQIVEQRIGRNS